MLADKCRQSITTEILNPSENCTSDSKKYGFMYMMIFMWRCPLNWIFKKSEAERKTCTVTVSSPY